MTESTELDRARDHAIALASRLDPRTASVEDERELAEAMVDVRSHLRTREGAVDWQAKSGAAKSMASEIYSAIDTDKDELERLKRRLRQHFLRIIPTRVSEDDVAALVKEGEGAFTPDSFYDDLGVFIANLGRPAVTDTEAVQLAIAAGKLLDFIDAEQIRDAGPVASATVLAALQAVSDQALAIHKRLNHR